MIEKVEVRLGGGGPVGDEPAFIGPPEHGRFFVGEGNGEFDSGEFDIAFETALSHEPVDWGLRDAALAAGLSAEDGPAESADAIVGLGGEPGYVGTEETFEIVLFDGLGLEGPTIGKSDGDLTAGTEAEEGRFTGGEPGEGIAGEACEGAERVFPMIGIHACDHLAKPGQGSDFIGRGLLGNELFKLALERSCKHPYQRIASGVALGRAIMKFG